ncbi:MAG: class I SAM-dependent methyltransferase, partial [Candidatus Micrarchaeota archaeon]
FGGKAELVLANLKHLPFKAGKFDAIVHQGILEHFTEKGAIAIIRHHLSLAPLVIFSVPVRSPYTEDYFSSDSVGRNLHPREKWGKMLGSFNVKEMKVAKQRTTNLLVVISR